MADVKTAFLQASRRKVKGNCTVASPPQVVRDLGIMRFGKEERWVVRGALYGLAESPKDWGCYRDGWLRRMAWTEEQRRFLLVATAEVHLWRALCTVEDPDATPEEVGYIGVYVDVDDLMVSARKDAMDGILNELSRTFTMAQLEKVEGEQPVTFCGYEIKKVRDLDR